MFRRHMANRLRIGRFLGIDLYVHWTFWLLLLAVGAYSRSEGDSYFTAGIQILQILALFLCVTLHEYGHAMMARCFKVRTVDITLLPIGGLARLERMPRVPWQELLVAVAGPAVNLVIAAVTGVVLVVAIQGGWISTIGGTTVEGYLASAMMHPIGWLLVMNLILVVFNMVPAFPMDGGRVLRALLAMIFEYRLATQAAARVGFVAAAGLAIFGLWKGIPMMPLISLFIGYAGWVEARQVEMVEAVRGVRVLEGMVRPTDSLFATDSLEKIVDFFGGYSEAEVPVLGVNEVYLGMLGIDRVAEAVAAERWDLQAANLMDAERETVKPNGMLERQIARLNQTAQELVPIVDSNGRLSGMLDLRSLNARVVISRHLERKARTAPVEQVERVADVPPPGTIRDSYI
jgi:Zn-dependent protease